MSAKPSRLRAAASGLPKPVTDQEDAEQIAREGHDKNVRQTLYLPPGVHDQLRDYAYTHRMSMQAIVRDALDLWFADKGLPSWDELAPPKQRKG
jgi:hypothetical protein